jgi:hypothetical protein
MPPFLVINAAATVCSIFDHPKTATGSASMNFLAKLATMGIGQNWDRSFHLSNGRQLPTDSAMQLDHGLLNNTNITKDNLKANEDK